MAKKVIKASELLDSKIKGLVLVKQTDINLDCVEQFEAARVVCICDKSAAMAVAMQCSGCSNLCDVHQINTYGDLCDVVPKRWIRDFYRGYRDDDRDTKITDVKIIVISYSTENGETCALSLFELIPIKKFDSRGVSYVCDNFLYVQPESKVFEFVIDDEDENESDCDEEEDSDDAEVNKCFISYTDLNQSVHHNNLANFDVDEAEEE